MNHGQNEGLENEKKTPSEEPIEEPIKDLDRLENLTKLMEKQNNAILLLTGKLVETTKKLEDLGTHQDQSDAALIEVAKKVGGGGGGGGGAGNLLAQILPYLTQPRGSDPLTKMAMNSFMRNIAFTSLTTERIAKRQFGDEYTKMVKDMEAELSGATEPQ